MTYGWNISKPRHLKRKLTARPDSTIMGNKYPLKKISRASVYPVKYDIKECCNVFPFAMRRRAGAK